MQFAMPFLDSPGCENSPKKKKKNTGADKLLIILSNCEPYPMQRPAKICEKMKGTSKKLEIPSKNLRDTCEKQNAL
jgi:hypothetical protein